MTPLQSMRITGLRATLNWMVVVLHAWAAFQYVPNPAVVPLQWNLARWLSNSLAVSLLPALFFLSGLLFGSNYDGSLNNTVQKIRSRVHSLVVPYLLWNATFVVVYLVLANWVPRLQARVETYELTSIAGCANAVLGITTGPINGPLWFVRNLFLLVLLTPLLYRLLKRLGMVVLLLLGLLMFCMTDVNPQWHPYCLFYFAVGLYVSIRKRVGIDAFDRQAWYVIPVFVAASILHWRWGSYHAALRYLYFLGAVPFWMACSRWLVFKPASPLARLLLPSTFFVYASHFLFCSMLMHFTAAHLPPTQFMLSILYFVFIVIGGLTCIGAYWTLRHLSPRLCTWYSGGRG